MVLTNINVYDMLIHGTLAALGGIVKELKKHENPTFVDFLIGACVGIFCGIVIFCLCRNYGAGDYLTAALTSLGGYIGTPVLDLISSIIKKLLTLRFGNGSNS